MNLILIKYNYELLKMSCGGGSCKNCDIMWMINCDGMIKNSYVIESWFLCKFYYKDYIEL